MAALALTFGSPDGTVLALRALFVLLEVCHFRYVWFGQMEEDCCCFGSVVGVVEVESRT
jgi:hypothetical protein